MTLNVMFVGFDVCSRGLNHGSTRFTHDISLKRFRMLHFIVFIVIALSEEEGIGEEENGD